MVIRRPEKERRSNPHQPSAESRRRWPSPPNKLSPPSGVSTRSPPGPPASNRGVNYSSENGSEVGPGSGMSKNRRSHQNKGAEPLLLVVGMNKISPAGLCPRLGGSVWALPSVTEIR
jgi:hypothetical protein